MRLNKRPGLSKGTSNPGNENERYGMYTYPCVQGGLLVDGHNHFGWTQSQASGCHYGGSNYVDIWLQRSVTTNDNKGIYEQMMDYNVAYYSFAFYAENSGKAYMRIKTEAD